MAIRSPHNQTAVGESIIILDFGAQYTQLIARRIREQNVFSVVLPCTAKLDEVKSYAPAGIILSGAPWSVYDKDAPPADVRVFDLGLPVLGICYGLQFMVHTLAGKVRPAVTKAVAVANAIRAAKKRPPFISAPAGHREVRRALRARRRPIRPRRLRRNTPPQSGCVSRRRAFA